MTRLSGRLFLGAVAALLPIAGGWAESTAPTNGALPEGSGRDIAAARCVSCHDIGRLVTPGYSREGWQDVIERLSDYLARSFSPHPEVACAALWPNTLVRFDPKSSAFQSWPIPSGGGVVRNMMARRDHGLVPAESGVGKLALVEVG